ncbi:Sulphatase-modifying factor protein [Thalassoporum mexicanum PCC 7367]|uniref:formylglycine-generating enzyme family protein n=1 Tax=Thalassoporum mexicanum TaxID=3457544 RepID=UPI00029FA920|nr:formylglycine-generating enzyme family protein [Pseudanabaena sp. PCC 7367]AFY71171.1 Sulphatase-modifying factor protein [Pseudanabaena sp. PCC 7367]
MPVNPKKLLTRRNLILGSLAGAGLTSALAIKRIKSLSGGAIASELDLQSFDFETVKVNEFGKIVDRQTLQGQKFMEDLGSGVQLEMVSIPGGSFLMGTYPNEEGIYEGDKSEPQHQVKIKPFYLGMYLITQEQWLAVMGKFLREPKYPGDNKPLERVDWIGAQDFCKALSDKTGKKYRLPSEAEWEYACRAGTTTPFHFGETITTDIANYSGNDKPYGKGSQGNYRGETTEVGEFPANPWGLYDMHGNLYEWCEDAWHESYHGAPRNGSARKSALQLIGYPYRVVRGGSWISSPHSCRSAYRTEYSATDTQSRIGFRVVCSAA